MAKDGLSILLVLIFSSLGCLLLYYASHRAFFLFAFFFILILTLFTAWFFRDPERVIPGEPGLIVSPADGRVIDIVEEENKYLGGRSRRVSIFLNVFNVHINRIPADGTVELVQYYKGKFLAAWDDKASLDNEQTHIGIQCDGYRILVKQIAGLIARRIVCHAREGAAYKRGERFGMIKFGSRTDLFLPLSVEIRVKVGDRVQGGSSIIAAVRPQ